MNNPILALLRGARTTTGDGLEIASTMTKPSAGLSRRNYPTRRVLPPLCWALLAIVFGVAALLLTHQSSQAQTAQEGVEAWLPISYPRTPEQTWSGGPAAYTDAKLGALMDEAKSAGADGVKMQADWWLIEPTDNNYYWPYTDRFVNMAEARGLKVGFQITSAPPFARQSGGDYGGWDPPRTETELGYFRDFVFDLVNRYGTRVERYSIWNEPNHESFWKPARNPAEYAALLRAGYLGAKSANPKVKVSAFDLSNNDVGFLNSAYGAISGYPDAASNNNFFDELSVHPYPYCGSTPYAPEDATECSWQGPWGTVYGKFLGYRRMHDALLSHGDGAKPIYIGETGYQTIQCWGAPISDAQRADYLKRLFAVAEQDASYLSGIDWYSFYSDTSCGWQTYDYSTGAETLTFQALREVNSGTPSPPPPPSETLIFAPRADAYVNEASKGTNYGGNSQLISDGDSGAQKIVYLKFDVSGVGTKTVQSAALRLYVKDGGGSANGPGVRRSASTWTEGGVTWNNRPAYWTSLQDDKAAVASSSWMTFDVTNLVSADGTVTLAVQPTSSDGTYMYSKEGTFKPRLVVTLRG
jgi:polysaccharide biosynthesis protein PslG